MFTQMKGGPVAKNHYSFEKRRKELEKKKKKEAKRLARLARKGQPENGEAPDPDAVETDAVETDAAPEPKPEETPAAPERRKTIDDLW